jgi:hypothetical protein
MGAGRFSEEAYLSLKKEKDYDSKSREQIFAARRIDPEMDPTGVQWRESRDSPEHPESLAIIVGLDVTGSMGFVPELIVKESLPDLVGSVIKAGIPDPQVLFLGIGDFVYDKAPLQVGQFESSAELLDRWLTKVYLEGGGGGNNYESYTLAWLVAARHTKIDCFEKRKQKGFVFTIGDEPVNPDIPAEIIHRLTPDKQGRTITSEELLAETRERYHVSHIHLLHSRGAISPDRQSGWRELLGQDFCTLEDHKLLASFIAQVVIDRFTADRRSAAEGSLEAIGKKPIEEML